MRLSGKPTRLLHPLLWNNKRIFLYSHYRGSSKMCFRSLDNGPTCGLQSALSEEALLEKVLQSAIEERMRD